MPYRIHNMDYSKQFLKGIPHEDFIGDDNGPTSDLFHFDESHQKGTRDDDYWEESINWRDDKGADEVLFTQTKKDGSIHFKAGAAVMCRIELDRMIRKPLLRDRLSYERKEITGNKYHGNLLLKNNVKKRVDGR